MNAEKYHLDRIYFGGCFIRGEKTCYDLDQNVDLSMIQGMRLQLQHCLMPSVSGAKGRSVLCSCDMKDFCE